MVFIKSQFDEKIAKKILANKETALLYLKELSNNINITELSNFKKKDIKDIWSLVIKYWDYNKSKDVIRTLFRNTMKYQTGTSSSDAINKLMEEWKKLGLGNLDWPCSQGQFDQFVQHINSLSDNGLIKDEKVKIAAVKYRRLKEINTVRNDYLETLIFEKNLNIVPTLSHNKGIDFFIDGESYDQKVSRSVTKEFMKDFGSNWKESAIKNPAKVAEYLYKYQDEGRFGHDPRLYIVYLDENIPVIKLKEKIDQIDLSKPIELTFEYNHDKVGKKQYKTKCFIILLSN